MYYKEAILCLMFATAEADGQMREDELISIVTMKDVFRGHNEQDIIALYKEYKERFADKDFSETASIMTRQIPEELFLATLSILADIIVLDFNVDIKEGSFISIVANHMGISDTAVKVLLLTALSRKLMMNTGRGEPFTS
ncbi:MAG: TerB family tellurite resistance protein [Chitinophagales bacterium]|nr:TerB family tellurite resistance protein [Chitinophagaceae bacterium]MCB9065412.1 TerB family tellurite resistance protein [Chitinophagales bacterium]